MSPPAGIIAAAESAARQSPCAKSKRGAVVFSEYTGVVVTYGAGFNGQPAPFACTGTDRCRELCEHAEGRAIRTAAGELHGVRALGIDLRCDLVHVKIGDDGKLVAGGGPKCWQCSRAILDCGFIDGVWLYQAMQGYDIRTEPSGEVVANPIGQSVAVWCRYLAEEFHRITLRNCEMEL